MNFPPTQIRQNCVVLVESYLLFYNLHDYTVYAARATANVPTTNDVGDDCKSK